MDLRQGNEVEASLMAIRRTAANHHNEDDDNKFYDFTIFTVPPSGNRAGRVFLELELLGGDSSEHDNSFLRNCLKTLHQCQPLKRILNNKNIFVCLVLQREMLNVGCCAFQMISCCSICRENQADMILQQ